MIGVYGRTVSHFATQIIAVPVYDLTKKGNFAYPLCDKVFDLRNDLGSRSATLHSSSEWDNAECACVATTEHNRNVGCDRCNPILGQISN